MTLRFDHVSSVPIFEYVTLKDVCFELPADRVLAFYGQTRAGHIEALRAIAGMLSLRRGSITHDGYELTTRPAVERPVTYVFPNQTLDPAKRVTDFALAGTVLARAGLTRVQDLQVRDLREDDRFMLHLAQLPLQATRLLLMEEALDLFDRRRQFALIRRMHRFLADVSVTAIYASSDLDVIRAFADRYIRFEQGQVQS